MNSTLVRFPSNLTEESAFEVCCELNLYGCIETIILDISACIWACPFGALTIGSQVRHLRECFGSDFLLKGFDSTNGAHTFLAHIGFFRFAGFDIGNHPGQAKGGSRYLPITVLNKTDLLLDELISNKPIQQEIEKKSDSLAHLLTNSWEGKVTRPIRYCFRELIRNVFEHSTAEECYLVAQAYNGGRVGIGIVDHGRGLTASLSERFAISNDREAVDLALSPGVSRSVPDPTDENPWANSGFGLFVLSELGRQTDNFSIASSSQRLVMKKESREYSDVCHQGTSIAIHFNKKYGEALEETIKDIIQQGERLAASEGRPSRASRSTKKI
jgi:hypothetical protein